MTQTFLSVLSGTRNTPRRHAKQVGGAMPLFPCEMVATAQTGMSVSLLGRRRREEGRSFGRLPPIRLFRLLLSGLQADETELVPPRGGWTNHPLPIAIEGIGHRTFRRSRDAPPYLELDANPPPSFILQIIPPRYRPYIFDTVRGIDGRKGRGVRRPRPDGTWRRRGPGEDSRSQNRAPHC